MVLWISEGVYHEDLRLAIPLITNVGFATDRAESIKEAIHDLEFSERPDVIVIGRVVLSTERYPERKRKKDRTVWEKANEKGNPLRIELVKWLLGTPDALEQIGEAKKFDPKQILVYGSLRDDEEKILRNMGIENVVIIESNDSLVILNALRKMVASNQEQPLPAE